MVFLKTNLIFFALCYFLLPSFPFKKSKEDYKGSKRQDKKKTTKCKSKNEYKRLRMSTKFTSSNLFLRNLIF